jgi:hypothetical protein
MCAFFMSAKHYYLHTSIIMFLKIYLKTAPRQISEQKRQATLENFFQNFT